MSRMIIAELNQFNPAASETLVQASSAAPSMLKLLFLSEFN